MALAHSPKVVTDGLVFYYDMANNQKSFQGPPTTNISAGTGIGTYLNTPSDVTSSLTVTTESYRGQPVYKQVLTPVTATGVSYLTNAGNPGIGTVTGGGGGAAARYTGHSIFFKPAVGRSGLNSSTPIYTHYSNIGGWQSTGNYDDMGDGWYRAHVIFYSAGGGSDGKYWAINPAGATLNIPITVYWAAPFKEDRNDSTFVSPYTNNTRSNTQAILDTIGNKTITPTNLNSTSYLNNTCITLDGINQYLYTSGDSYWNAWSPDGTNGNANMTIELIFNSSDSGYLISRPWNGGGQYNYTITSTGFGLHSNASGVSMGFSSICTGTNVHMLFWMNSTQYGVYKNGVEYVGATNHGLSGNGGSSGSSAFGTLFGSLYPYGEGWGGNTGLSIAGKYYLSRIYNRVLSAAEVKQNFNALRGKYGL